MLDDLAAPQHSRGSLLDTVRAHLHGTDDEHRTTTLELLFDLVFVYAITNVTALMEHEVGGRTIVQGLVTLSVVWFGWCAYVWLGNHAKADEGVMRVAMIVALTGMFFVAVSVPHAFGDRRTALVLVGAYAVVRLVHITVYLIAAGDDVALRSALRGMVAVIGVVLVILFVGAVAPGHDRQWWWLAAVLVDQLGVYFVRSTRWRLNSATHFAERFGLVILIAIGESIVDLGTASSDAPLTLHRGIGLVLGVAIAVCLWWLYFDVIALAAERTLRASIGVRRARLARDSYTYLHLPMVAGIVFVAMGLALLVAEEHVSAGRYALYGGIALYLGAHAAFRMRNVGGVNVPRTCALVAVATALPLVPRLAPLAQIVVAAVVLTALVVVEVRAFRELREQIRHPVG